MDLSKTKIFTLSGSTSVGSDGKASIPFLTGSAQLAFLFDEADNLILASYITSTQKEISVKTTAQAMLFQGLQQVFLPDSAKFVFLEKSATATKLADYYSKMEQTFKTDPLMLEKRTFENTLREVIATVTEENPIDIYGKQMYIVDEDEKAGLRLKK